MQQRRWSWMLALAIGVAAVGRASDERGLWSLWQQHVERPDRHEDLAVACLKFAEGPASGSLSVVGGSLAAWHFLAAQDHKRARELLDSQVARPAGALGEAAAEIARTWLTRMDLEDLRRALKERYLADVAYPDELRQLAKGAGNGAPRMQDRWGKAWHYRLTGFKRLRGLRNQKYELWSRTLGAGSDLRVALAREYADTIPLTAVRIVPSAPGREVIQLRDHNTEDDIYLAAGAASGHTRLAYLGTHLVVLSSREHWLVLPRPR